MRCWCPVATIALVLAASDAFAAQRTFVASYGNDANVCSLTLPCRSFGRALTQTNVDGEIVALDSAGYGTVAINQAVSIIAPSGVYAGISVASGSHGVAVNVGNVVLRGLTINGVATGSMVGIHVTEPNEVHIERCVVSNMGQEGIRVAPTAASPRVYVSDTVLRSNGSNGGIGGIWMTGDTNPELYVADTFAIGNAGHGIVTTGGTATIERLRTERNVSAGVYAYALSATVVKTLVRDSVAANNGDSGFAVRADDGFAARLTVERSSSMFSSSGMVAVTAPTGVATLTVAYSLSSEHEVDGILADGAGAKALVTASTVTRNGGAGLATMMSGTIETAGNNFVRENFGGATSGTVVPVGTL